MTIFAVSLCISLAISGTIGYRFACNSALQGIPRSQRIACRTAQLCGASLILIVEWTHVPNLWFSCIPIGVLLFYAGTATAFALWLKRFRNSKQETGTYEAPRAFIRTSICVTIFMEMALLLFVSLVAVFGDQSVDRVSPLDRFLCHGLLLGVSTVLLCLLAHKMIIFLKHPADESNISQAMLVLQKKLASPPTMH